MLFNRIPLPRPVRTVHLNPFSDNGQAIRSLQGAEDLMDWAEAGGGFDELDESD